jgi:hypothetical protein
MLDYFLVTGYDIVETEAFSNLFLDEYLIGSVLFDYNNISLIFNSIEDDSNLSFLFYFVLYKSYFLDIPNSIWRLWRLIVY